MDQHKILERVSTYYSDKIRTHGTTARGADWRDEQSQNLRFARLLDAIENKDSNSSISELGCGYGALVTYLRAQGYTNDYVGVDISIEMIKAAGNLHGNIAGARFQRGDVPHPADYVVASGIFNVRFDISDDEWLPFVDQTIEIMVKNARKAVAFNCLTAYSDPHRMDSRLFYSSPERMISKCVAKYGRHVALRHDYGLYEYTMIIRKSLEGQS